MRKYMLPLRKVKRAEKRRDRYLQSISAEKQRYGFLGRKTRWVLPKEVKEHREKAFSSILVNMEECNMIMDQLKDLETLMALKKSGQLDEKGPQPPANVTLREVQELKTMAESSYVRYNLEKEKMLLEARIGLGYDLDLGTAKNVRLSQRSGRKGFSKWLHGVTVLPARLHSRATRAKLLQRLAEVDNRIRELHGRGFDSSRYDELIDKILPDIHKRAQEKRAYYR